MISKLISIASCFVLCITLFAQDEIKRFSILGDSYSTYEGYVYPEWNDIWYADTIAPRYSVTNDVRSVDYTWWKLLDNHPSFQLDVNNSWSGSTISLSGYDGADYSDRSFLTRAVNLGHPDIIFVFGGTNDYWAKAPIGDYCFDNWDKEQLYAYRPALAMLFSQLKSLYPDAIIYNILNTDLSPEINESTEVICNHYGIHLIKPLQIDKIDGHPSRQGMLQLYNTILQSLTPFF